MQTPQHRQPSLPDDEGSPSTQRARAEAPRARGQGTTLVSAEGSPTSEAVARGIRAHDRRRAARIGSEDTLLSMPSPGDEEPEPAASEELLVLQRRVDELTERVRALESAPRPAVPDSGARRWLVWAVFLVALGITWQLLKSLR